MAAFRQLKLSKGNPTAADSVLHFVSGTVKLLLLFKVRLWEHSKARYGAGME